MNFYSISSVVIVIFLIISYWMILKYVINIFKTFRYLKKCKHVKPYYLKSKVSIMIVIPVLREQNIICDTIDYFAELSSHNLYIHFVIAGTKREYETLEKYGFIMSTKEVVEKHIMNKKYDSSFKVHLYEADDINKGDRATQLNFAVQQCIKEEQNIDLIGVYDADSRPSLETIFEVASKFIDDKTCSYQQPAFFIHVANKMMEKNENPVLVANALYQNTWSIISEIPMWINYGLKKGKSNQYFYCIGHGEFFPVDVYMKY